jgi:hypothetical protein
MDFETSFSRIYLLKLNVYSSGSAQNHDKRIASSEKNPDKPILPAWVKRGAAALRLSLGRFRGQRSLNQRV